MKILLQAVLLPLCSAANTAKKYSFLPGIEDDSRTSIQAQQPATSRANISKYNSNLNCFAANTNVLLSHSNTFYTSITTPITNIQLSQSTLCRANILFV